MRSVRLFDYLQYDGHSWQVVAQDGPELALKNLVSGRIRRVGIGELLGDDSYRPDTPDRLPRLDSAAVLETLDPETRRRVVFLHHHVVEVLTGSPPASVTAADDGRATQTQMCCDGVDVGSHVCRAPSRSKPPGLACAAADVDGDYTAAVCEPSKLA